MPEQEARQCWACGGVMVLKKDKMGDYFECSNGLCKATLTDLGKPIIVTGVIKKEIKGGKHAGRKETR
jgi:hypothetical protein